MTISLLRNCGCSFSARQQPAGGVIVNISGCYPQVVILAQNCVHSMLFYPTIARKYFVKTQTYVALFGPHELSLIFAGGMCLEQTSL